MKNNFEHSSSDRIELADMGLVSSLVSLGFPVLTTLRNPSDYQKVNFVFLKTEKLEEAIKNFFDGSLLVEPKSYWATVRELKGRIRANQ